MSTRAEVWAGKVKGLSIVEHAVLDRLARVHTAKHGCFPSIERIAGRLESTRRHIERTIGSLVEKQLISKEPDFLYGRQTSNHYTLHFERFFPPSPPADRLLTIVKMSLKGSVKTDFYEEWIKGLSDCYLEERKSAPQHIFWIAVESRSHERTLERHLPAITQLVTAKFGTVGRKLPNANVLQPRKNETPAQFDQRRKLYPDRRTVPAIKIKILSTYLNDDDE